MFSLVLTYLSQLFPTGRRYSVGSMIQFNTSSPYANARRRIRSWLRYGI